MIEISISSYTYCTPQSPRKFKSLHFSMTVLRVAMLAFSELRVLENLKKQSVTNKRLL